MSTKVFFIDSADAQYTSEEFAWLQQIFLGEGIFGDSAGTLGLAVSERGAGANMSVDVATGNALVELTKTARTWKVLFMNNAVVNVPIANNTSGSNRVDAIVVRIDVDADPNSLKNNIGTIEVVLGSGISALSDGAITTALGSDGWVRLANITVANADTDITTGQIADTRVAVKTNEAMVLAPKTINFTVQASDPSTLVEGMVWYNSTNHTLNFYNNSTVKQLGSSQGLFNPFVASAQSTPNMTLAVSAGSVRFNGVNVNYAGGNSGSFTAPATGGHKRIDLLCLDSSGALSIVQGVSDPTSPVVPSYPPALFVIAEVYLRNGATSIKDTDDSTNGYIYRDSRGFSVFTPKFGGTGADGDLAISSGTTTIDLGGAQYFEKNYKSISITGTASLAFTNPHANGTIIIIKCQGDCVLTSSNPSIDTSGMGAQGGASVTTQNTAGNAGSLPTIINNITQTNAFGAGGLTNGSTVNGAIYVSSATFTVSAFQLSLKQSLVIASGAGGGSGSVAGGGSGTSGAGGRGGGGLYMEIGGSINFTGSIKTNGLDGANGTGNSGSGGGGGSAGTAVILYNILVSVSGTMTCKGGDGGTSVNAGYSNGAGAGAGSALSAGGASQNGSGVGNNGALGSGGGGNCNFGGTSRTGGTGGSNGASLVAKNNYF